MHLSIMRHFYFVFLNTLEFPIPQHTPIEQHNMMGAPVLRPMIQALPPCHLHTYARARIALRTTAYIPTEEGHKEHLIIGNLQH